VPRQVHEERFLNSCPPADLLQGEIQFLVGHHLPHKILAAAGGGVFQLDPFGRIQQRDIAEHPGFFGSFSFFGERQYIWQKMGYWKGSF
jgi:hypothetical protein